MKKVSVVVGIAGLVLLGASAPANADPEGKISICHATGSESNPYVEITISENGLNGHNAQGVHDGDIVPAPSGGCPSGDDNDHGNNGSESKKVTFCHATGSEKNPYVVITTSEEAWLHGHKDGHNGKADIYPVPDNGCLADDDHNGENPGGGGGATEPPAGEETVVPPGATEVVPGAAAVVPSGAGAGAEVNRGFNAQTSVASTTEAGLPGWAAGLAALLTAASVVGMRRRARKQGADASL